MQPLRKSFALILATLIVGWSGYTHSQSPRSARTNENAKQISTRHSGHDAYNHQAEARDPSPAINQPKPEETSTPNTTYNLNYSGNRNYRVTNSTWWLSFWQSAATVALAFFAIGQVYFLWRTRDETQRAATAATRNAEAMTSSLAFLRQSAEATERQARTLEESLIETRKAADAAKASADFLKLTERAFVLLDESRSPDPREKAEMIYWIVNCGKTPAYIKVVKAWMEFTDSGLPPPVHTLANVSYKHVGEMAVLGPSQTFDAGVDLPGSKTLECQQIEAIKDKTRWLWFCGWIAYSDAFDNEHVTVWTRYWNPVEEDIPQGVFGFPGQPGYNY